MKKIFKFLLGLMTMLLLVACGDKKAAEAVEGTHKVAIVYSTGGKGDKSFNDSAYRGLVEAKEKYGIEFSEYEPKDPSAEAKNKLSEFAATGEYDLIIGVGFTMKDSLEAVATDFPEQKFALIDEVIADKDNVVSILFKEQEGSFLTGALAAMMTKTGTLGFVGGVEAPVIYRFESGFEQGAKYVNPDIKILSVFIGGNNAFNDPVAAKQLSQTLIDKGADVLFQVAGGSGAGVFQAAKERGVFAIGVDSNQDDVQPGVILTSMVKNVDKAVLAEIGTVLEGKFEPGVVLFGLNEEGVGTTDFEFTKDIIGNDILSKLDELKADISNGKIKVEQYLERHNQK